MDPPIIKLRNLQLNKINLTAQVYIRTLCVNFKGNRPTLISKSAPVSQTEASKFFELLLLLAIYPLQWLLESLLS